ncbi:MAG: tyrosine recombinase XerC [Streptosporangiaceae bacterium]|jgi:integrase
MARRRQHGEGSLYHRKGDGRWVATVNEGYRNGIRQRRVFTGLTPEEAMKKRTVFLQKKDSGFRMPKGRAPYVDEWAKHWLVNVAKPRVSATTFEGSYRSKVMDHVVPYFAGVLLPELDEEKVESFHRHLERKGLSAATIVQIHRIMSSAIKEAVIRGKLPRNPVSNVTPPAIERDETEPPTEAEIRRILAACADWPAGARWIVAIATGARQGELLGLQWQDVQLSDPAAITIRQSASRVHGKLVLKKPKSRKSRRTIAIGPATVAALKAHRQASGVASLAGFVFTDGRGQPLHPRADWQDWCNLLDHAGVRHYRIHDLRHAAATMLLEAGTDVRVVQEVMGHATPGFTQAQYQHVRPVLHQRAADAMDAIIDRR